VRAIPPAANHWYIQAIASRCGRVILSCVVQITDQSNHHPPSSPDSCTHIHCTSVARQHHANRVHGMSVESLQECKTQQRVRASFRLLRSWISFSEKYAVVFPQLCVIINVILASWLLVLQSRRFDYLAEVVVISSVSSIDMLISSPSQETSSSGSALDISNFDFLLSCRRFYRLSCRRSSLVIKTSKMRGNICFGR